MGGSGFGGLIDSVNLNCVTCAMVVTPALPSSKRRGTQLDCARDSVLGMVADYEPRLAMAWQLGDAGVSSWNSPKHLKLIAAHPTTGSSDCGIGNH
jgi:hypothetical protein